MKKKQHGSSRNTVSAQHSEFNWIENKNMKRSELDYLSCQTV